MSPIDQDVPDNTRLLKIIVVVLGILLVVGFIVVIATIIIRLGNLGTDSDAAPIVPAQTALTTAPTNNSLPLLSGESIQDFTLDGDRMVVHVKGPTSNRLLVVDVNNGAITQTLVVTSGDQ